MSSHKKSTISAVVLTYNEENNLKDCLQSLKWCDEIIVVDSGSTDQTQKIAEEEGAKFILHELPFFRVLTQRNWILENVPLAGDWILFIDADERVPKELAVEIGKVIDEASKEVIGFKLAPKFIFMNQWLRRTMRFPAWHERLIRKGQVFSKPNPLTIDDLCLDDSRGIIKKIKNPYLHYGFNNGMERWFDKHNSYSTIIARQMVKLTKNDVLSGAKKVEVWMNRSLLLGPLFRLFYCLFWRGGILEGKAGITYSFMMGFYQFMICLKVEELRRREKGEPL